MTRSATDTHTPYTHSFCLQTHCSSIMSNENVLLRLCRSSSLPRGHGKVERGDHTSGLCPRRRRAGGSGAAAIKGLNMSLTKRLVWKPCGNLCVECLIGKQKKPTLFQVTEPSSVPRSQPHRVVPNKLKLSEKKKTYDVQQGRTNCLCPSGAKSTEPCHRQRRWDPAAQWHRHS